MSQYRLHIDIPLLGGEAEAIKISNAIISILNDKNKMTNLGVEQINFRLGHDDDRQKSNHLSKNENGHINNKKNKILFTDQLTSAEDMVQYIHQCAVGGLGYLNPAYNGTRLGSNPRRHTTLRNTISVTWFKKQ